MRIQLYTMPPLAKHGKQLHPALASKGVGMWQFKCFLEQGSIFPVFSVLNI